MTLGLCGSGLIKKSARANPKGWTKRLFGSAWSRFFRFRSILGRSPAEEEEERGGRSSSLPKGVLFQRARVSDTCGPNENNFFFKTPCNWRFHLLKRCAPAEIHCSIWRHNASWGTEIVQFGEPPLIYETQSFFPFSWDTGGEVVRNYKVFPRLGRPRARAFRHGARAREAVLIQTPPPTSSEKKISVRLSSGGLCQVIQMVLLLWAGGRAAANSTTRDDNDFHLVRYALSSRSSSPLSSSGPLFLTSLLSRAERERERERKDSSSSTNGPLYSNGKFLSQEGRGTRWGKAHLWRNIYNTIRTQLS